jgi:hypothetical protein
MRALTQFKRHSLFGYDEVVSVYRCNGYYNVGQYQGPMRHGFFNIFDGDDLYTQLDRALEAGEQDTFDLLIEERIRDTEVTVLKICGE